MVESPIKISKTSGNNLPNSYTVFIDGDIIYPHQFRDLMLLLDNKSVLSINFHITSWGGTLSTAMMIVDGIVSTSAITHAIVHTAASSASLIAFACDKITLFSTSTIMLHPFQYPSNKDEDIDTEFEDRKFDLICKSVYNGVISDEDIESILKGNELWYTGVDIMNNMEKFEWKPLKKRIQQKQSQD